MGSELTVRSEQAVAVHHSFQEMERMATYVAKAGIFGVKTVDAAMALMLLAQSEGIHPMKAVQEYDIIQGRPAMKATAMAARFEAAGGKITWRKLDDVQAEAEFSHPTGGTIVIGWDLDKAKRAGLAGKDVWKAYPRAMLRSRVVSEGIRTVLPGVLGGKYTPEEAMHIETVEPISVEAFIAGAERLGLSQADTDSYLKDITQAPTLEALKDNFGAAWKAAKAAGDEQRAVTLKTAYDARRDELALDELDAKQKVEGEQI